MTDRRLGFGSVGFIYRKQKIKIKTTVFTIFGIIHINWLWIILLKYGIKSSLHNVSVQSAQLLQLSTVGVLWTMRYIIISVPWVLLQLADLCHYLYPFRLANRMLIFIVRFFTVKKAIKCIKGRYFFSLRNGRLHLKYMSGQQATSRLPIFVKNERLVENCRSHVGSIFCEYYSSASFQFSLLWKSCNLHSESN